MLFYVILSIDLFLFLLLVYFLKKRKILFVICALILSAFTKFFITQAYKIPSGSMLPILLIGDHVLTNKYIYRFSEPTRGDIVIFPFPKKPDLDYIKRVVAVGGDTLEIVDKIVYVNEKQLVEPYVIHTDSEILPSSVSPRDNFGPITIPENNVFVLGDNRNSSYDSRFWGPVKQDTVKDRVELIYWSWDKEEETARWERIGNTVK